MARDMLFATLDPTMRAVELPSGRKMILSDTVGFISDLPTDLVAAFRATLEEVLEADLILHVRDISHPDSDAEAKDVRSVLTSLGIDGPAAAPVMEVWNKMDCLGREERSIITARWQRAELPSVLISALSGDGCENMLEKIDDLLGAHDRTVSFTLPHDAGQQVAWLYRHGDILSRDEGAESITLSVRLSAANLSRYRKRFEWETA